MEDGPEMRFELVVQKKEQSILSNHVPETRKVLKKIDFWYSKVCVSKWTQKENLIFWTFLCKQVCGSQPPNKMCKYFFQILKPVNNAEVLSPDLVGYQREMVV